MLFASFTREISILALEKLFGTVKFPVAKLIVNQVFKHEAELIKSKTFINIVPVEDSKSVLLHFKSFFNFRMLIKVFLKIQGFEQRHGV